MAQSQAEQQAQAQIAGEPTRTKERQPQPATGTAADPTAQAQQNDEQGGLERKMETRHLTMISLGGVIGTGLFLSSGYTIHQAGPLGAIIAYAIGSVLVYFIMLSLGELSVAMPYAGSFHLYAKRFIGPGTAFTIAVLYWLNWAVALASEFTAAGLLMQRWFPHSPAWDLVGRVHRGRVPAQHPVGAPVRRIGILVRVHQGVRHHRVHYHRPARHVRRDSDRRL